MIASAGGFQQRNPEEGFVSFAGISIQVIPVLPVMVSPVGTLDRCGKKSSKLCKSMLATVDIAQFLNNWKSFIIVRHVQIVVFLEYKF